MRRALLTTALVLTATVVPGAASAANIVVAADPNARAVTALNGTIVWATHSNEPSTPQVPLQLKLMKRDPRGTITPLTGAPSAAIYDNLDLGYDERGKLVLTYVRCVTSSRCKFLRDDLRGHRSSFRGYLPRRCSFATPPALWRSRAAYGLQCSKGTGSSQQTDWRRSGLYVKSTGRPPRRLRSPNERLNVPIRSVDLRGTRVAAVSETSARTFAENVDATRLTSFLATTSTQDTGNHASGLALGAGGAHWALSNPGSPYEPVGPKDTLIFRHHRGCLRHERITTPAAAPYAATDLAVDGTKLYLIVPTVGIVSHDFTPDPATRC